MIENNDRHQKTNVIVVEKPIKKDQKNSINNNTEITDIENVFTKLESDPSTETSGSIIYLLLKLSLKKI